jgi:putative oxidoreductase
MENLVALLFGWDPVFLYDLAMVILRVAVGICFFIHGLGKIGLVGSSDLQGFTAYLQALGIPFPALQARLAAGAEILGGAFLVLGFLTPISALFLFVTMLVAAFKGHKGGGYLILNNPPGNEYALNLAVVALFFLLAGPGSFSLDRLIF